MRNVPRRVLPRDINAGLVCRSCRQQRQFATSLSPPAPSISGIASLTSRRLISIHGPDSVKFLQGIVTASVASKDGLPRNDGFYTAFLTATGRVLYDVFMYPNHGLGASADEPGFLIEVDADQAQNLARHLKRYKLRAKLSVRLLAEGEATIWHAWDDSNTTSWDAITASSNLKILQDPRAPGFGYRFLQLDDKTPEVDLERTTQDAYTIRRYLQGVPEGQDEMAREASLPQESNMDMMNGIDYRKGCYVGQELTIRTKHRGVVRKRILPCVIYDKHEAAPSSLQYNPDAATASLEGSTAVMIPKDTSIGRFEKRGRSAGKWLKGVGNIGLGLCRLEIMTDVTLPGETAAASYNPEDEFVLDWGEEGSRSGVKVKAFVPDWLRAGLDAEKK